MLNFASLNGSGRLGKGKEVRVKIAKNDHIKSLPC